jgi:hypothetical protein
MAKSQKVVITCAITGAIHTPSMSPYLPVMPDQITEASIGAARAGAAIVHLHARDPKTGKPDQSPAAFAAFLSRIKPVSGHDIRTAIRQSGLEDADRHADIILDSAPLCDIAAVPLFLQAIVREAKLGNEILLGKQAMLRRMVERAVEEHRSALEYGEVRQHALRYLVDLAWEMTRAGKTTISEKDAHPAISNTVHKLKNEALQGEGPAPPDILKELLAGHLLISVYGNDVAFTHQLIQEHFAAIGIISALGEAVRNGD